MKLTLTHIGFVVLIIAFGVIIYLGKEVRDLKQNVADRDVTIESMALGLQEYKAKDGTWAQRLINERLSKDQVINSKDSTIIKMKDQLANMNIKLNNALAIGYTHTTISVDTVVKVVFRPSRDKPLDTTLDFSKRPHIINTVKITDSTATNQLIVKNEQILAVNAKKEFVNRRKNFFLWRWFQKRRWVIYTDIHNSNPYIKTDDAKFITIVESNGDTKTIK